MSALKNIKIATKTYAGFGIVLALLVAVAIVGYVGMTGADHGFGEYRSTALQRNSANRILIDVGEMRLAARTYLADPDDKKAEAVSQAVKDMAKTVAQGKERMVGHKERIAEIDKVDAMVKDYARIFDEIKVVRAGFEEVMNKDLNPNGRDMEQKLTKMMANTIQANNTEAANKFGLTVRSLLLARLYMLRFTAFTNVEEYQRAIKEMEVVDGLLKEIAPTLKVAENQKLIAEVQAQQKAYVEAMKTLHATRMKREDLVNNQLNKIGPQVTAIADKLIEEMRSIADALGPRVQAEIARSVTIMIVVSIIAIVIGALAAFLIGTGISRPILAMTAAMKTLAGGDKTVQIPGQDHKDEVGDMAAAVQVFKENMIKNDEMAAEEKRQQAIREARAQKVDGMTKSFDSDVNGVLNAVSAASTEMESTAGSMSATAEETSKQAGAVAAASEQASANVQTVASATEELSSSIQEITRQVTKSTEISSMAVREAEKTHAQVQGLAQAASKIGEVVKLITDIAEQTNLLALNATIEAARAGDAGKGFAVVASEVKNLANQTAKATEEIGAQISGIQNETQSAVEAIDSIGKIIGEMSEIATTIASAVEEQGAATKEIARNVEQASAGTSEVASNISGVNQAAGETGHAASQVLEASRELASQSEHLKSMVQKFLTDVRNA